MPSQVVLLHETLYSYPQPVILGPHLVRLRPTSHDFLEVLDFRLGIEPAHTLDWHQDPFGNWEGRLVFAEPTESLRLTLRLELLWRPLNPFSFLLEPQAVEMPWVYPVELLPGLAPYLETIEQPHLLGPQWNFGRSTTTVESAHASGEFPAIDRRTAPRPSEVPFRHAGGESQREGDDWARERSTLKFLSELNAAVARRIVYAERWEPGVQSPSETVTKGSGSCRDMAWLLVHLLRCRGWAARFVSGYVVFNDPHARGANLEGEMHAWTEVFLPGAGWRGLDPSRAIWAGQGYVALSRAPNPSLAAPVTGTHGGLEGGSEEVQFFHRIVVRQPGARWARSRLDSGISSFHGPPDGTSPRRYPRRTL